MLLVWAAVSMGAVTVSPSSSSSQGVVGDGTSVGTGISVGERCCPDAIAEEPNAEEPSMPDSTATTGADTLGLRADISVGEGRSVGTGSSLGDCVAADEDMPAIDEYT
mmetsp:Transcript_89252/g.213144  ORF Transcript_89252/g.213144 Transcript_89252/m.213144 type:complete len:108 (+) Transcript_89252:1084-1407(+)